MSADNTIGILVTRGEGIGLEYRVAHQQAIENLVWEPDYPADNPILNRQRVIERFGKSTVYSDEEAANQLACQLKADIESKYGIVEYGIRTLDYSNVFFPSNP